GSLRLHPAAAAELHGDVPAGQPLRELAEVVRVAVGSSEPGWELEEDGAQPARRGERLEGAAVELPETLQRLLAEIGAVRVSLRAGGGGQGIAQPARQAGDAGGMAGEQREGLDVEDEAGRSAVDPKPAVALRGRRVVRG